MRRKWNGDKNDLVPTKEPRGRPSKKDVGRSRRAEVRAMQEPDRDKRRRAIWEVYWQPELPWYPPVKEVAEQFGVTRQAVSNVRAWAVKNGLAVRTSEYVRYFLSPYDALEMCRRCWGPDDVRDKVTLVRDIIAEYGIGYRTAYSVYRRRYASGELQQQVDAMDRHWREQRGLT